MRVILSALFILYVLSTPLIANAKQPNIILILADDLGYSDLGCYGGEIQTPILDRLAANGLRFRRFYNSGKCEPTRASLLSGRYWQDCGFGLETGPTMGHVMRGAGYSTFCVGKWHLDGSPVNRGFDRYFGHLSGATDYFKGNSSYRLNTKHYQPQAGTFYSTDANGDFAIQFINESKAKDQGKPFFLYLAFNAPHSPLQALPEDISKYERKYDGGWDELRRARYRRQIELGIVEPDWPLPQRPATIPAWQSLSAEEKLFETRRMEVYAAMVDRMDQAIGRILDHISKLGVMDDTLIMFLSDNGASPYDRLERSRPSSSGTTHNVGLGWAHVSGTPFRHYKRNMHHGGNCSPMIVHWPAGVVQRGSITDQPGHIIDLMATFVELSDSTWPDQYAGKQMQPLYGCSLLPIFSNAEFHRKEPLYFHLMDHRAIVDGNRKLVSDWGRSWKLYNLLEDRTETNNLSLDQPMQAEKLSELWQAWFNKFSVRLSNQGGEPIYRHQTEAAQRFLPE